MAIAPLTEEQIAELKSKHAVMEGIEGPSCWLVFRKPTRHEYDRYLDSILADKSKARTSAWQLAQDTIVFPNAQALTDALNIGRSHGRTAGWDLSGLRVVIVGDVVSSRVARSNVGLLTALGARVTLCGPSMMCPDGLSALGCDVVRDLDSLVPDADVLMMLRIQFERGGGARLASRRLYHACYGLTLDRASRMKRGAIVMHPGPMNRGVEIEGTVADGLTSVIRDQVAGGVLVRQAALRTAILDR